MPYTISEEGREKLEKVIDSICDILLNDTQEKKLPNPGKLEETQPEREFKIGEFILYKPFLSASLPPSNLEWHEVLLSYISRDEDIYIVQFEMTTIHCKREQLKPIYPKNSITLELPEGMSYMKAWNLFEDYYYDNYDYERTHNADSIELNELTDKQLKGYWNEWLESLKK